MRIPSIALVCVTICSVSTTTRIGLTDSIVAIDDAVGSPKLPVAKKCVGSKCIGGRLDDPSLSTIRRLDIFTLSLLKLYPTTIRGRKKDSAPSLGKLVSRQHVLPGRSLASLVMAAGSKENVNREAFASTNQFPVGRRQAIAAGISAFIFKHPLRTLALDPSTTIEMLQRQEQTLEDLFKRATPSVVSINTFQKGYRGDEFAMNEVELPRGQGSGFLWDNNGHIVTNYHVIKGSQSAKVVVTRSSSAKPETYDAQLVGISPDKDIAVLQINDGKFDPSLTPVQISTRTAEVGATALAIGNPFGLDHTLTLGIVSGLGRQMTSPTGRPINNVIQTDASINPGNSGGVLLDSSGKLLGMNTAILSTSGSAAGIGFAIPADTIKQQVETLLRDGSVKRAVLGIELVPRSQSQALGVRKGVLIASTSGKAKKAGLRGLSKKYGYVELGDVIVKIQKTEVNGPTDLFKALDGYVAGDTVDVTVVRFVDDEENELTFSVELTEIEIN